MIVLDTDHFSELIDRRSGRGIELQQRLLACNEAFSITIITVEELMRGWLAYIHRRNDPHQQVAGYQRLQEFYKIVSQWNVLPWTAADADLFTFVKSTKPRPGTMDVKIAAICLNHKATLLTRNTRDFENVAGLKTEDWLS